MNKSSIKKYKNKLLIISIIFSILILIGIILQISSGKYENQVHIPVLWFFILNITVLFFTILIKDSSSINQNKTLILFLVLFFSLQILMFFFQPLFDNFSTVLLISFLILLPIEAYIIRTIWIFYIKPFKEKSLVQVNENQVFISYNHNDSEVALKIKTALEIENFDVVIDRDNMIAGGEIKEFIMNSIQQSAVTISLVSNKSLKSAWVAMETINSFMQVDVLNNKRLISCYLDEEFFQNDFTLNSIKEIDNKIKSNQDIIAESHEKMIDTRDLNTQNTRLLSLRNNLDEIVRRLRDSLCLDLREPTFNENIKKLVYSIQNPEL